MIETRNKIWRTLYDNIYVNDHKVIAVYAGERKVYPDDTRLRYAQWFNLDPAVVSSYDERPVNQYGVYLKFSDDEKPIRKVAVYIDTSQIPYRRNLYVTLKNFETTNGDLVYVPFVAMNGEVYQDGYSRDDINVFTLQQYTANDRVYYRNANTIGANLEDAQGNYLLNYENSRSSENVFVSTNETACINHVTT